MSVDELAENAGLDAFHPRRMSDFYAWDGDVLVLNVLGTPNAKRDVIGKPKGNQLQISVTAAPVRGYATDHMVRWLSELFAVKPHQIEVVFGRMNVNKQLRIKAPGRLPAVIARAEEKKR
jgi:uncharacterized protein (TIGR00251 family)